MPQGPARDQIRWPLWFVIVCVVSLGVGNWLLIEFFKDPKEPLQIGRMLQTALVAPALFALQPWLPWLRTTGFMLLLWLPCFAVMFLAIPVAGGTGGNPGLQTLAKWLLALALAGAWLIAARGLPALARGFSGTRPPSPAKTG